MLHIPASSADKVLAMCAADPGLEGMDTALLNLGPFFGRRALPLDRTGIFSHQLNGIRVILKRKI